MNDIVITGVTHGGASGLPAVETVSLAFAKVDLEYRPQKPDGSLEAGDSFQVRPQDQQSLVGPPVTAEDRLGPGRPWSRQKRRRAS